MPSDFSHLTLNIDAGLDADDGERIGLARTLRGELLALDDVERVESPSLVVDSRSKGVGIDWQTLIVTAAASGGVITTLIRAIQMWLMRHERTSVTLEMGGDKLVLTGASSESQQRLVKDWIERHGH